MAQIDLFDDTKVDSPHPRLRFWTDRLQGGDSAQLELYRPPLTFGMVQTKMYVHFFRDDKEVAVEEADWEQVLNEGLIALKVRAVDATNESARFALGLRDGLHPVEKEYGNGYFNAVLLDLIYESETNQNETIADVLKHTYHDSPERGQVYDRCRESIALGINARARELRLQLGYAPEQLKTILTAAIARYLDDRFSVSSRRQFGLL